MTHVVYEIGVRIGRKFAIHRDPSSLPDNPSALVIVGSDTLKRNDSVPSIVLDAPQALITPVADCLTSLDYESNLLGIALHLLQFAHENTSSLDRFGRVPSNANGLVASKCADVPWFEMIADEIWRRLCNAGCPQEPRLTAWPTDRTTFCMTHDVDGPELFSSFATVRSGILGFLNGDKYERESFLMSILFRLEGLDDPYLNFEAWRKYEAALGGQSTFFVCPGKMASARTHAKDPKYDPNKGVLKAKLCETADAGWEIGVHHPINSRNLESYAESREILSEAFSTDIVGGRGHYWMFDWKDPYRSWKDMSTAGFGYDMTLSPMALGFRCGAMSPLSPGIRWQNTSPADFIAVPTPVMDAYALPRETGLKSAEINSTLTSLVKSGRERGIALTLDWHERTFINRGAWTGYLRPLLFLLGEAEKTGGFTMISGRQLADDWRAHVKLIFGGIL